MNLDDVMEGWRAQDASTFFGVDKTLLHQTLRQEQAKLEKQWRGERWVMLAAGALFLFVAALILNMIYASSAGEALIGWDYAVGVVGVAAGVILAGALFGLLRIRRMREQGFGDSLRDHLRRRIAQLHDEATRESRLAFTTLVAGVIFMWAYPFVSHRSNAPQSASDWPSPLAIVLVLGFFCWVWFRSLPRERQRKVSRKRQLEALLKELDGQ